MSDQIPQSNAPMKGMQRVPINTKESQPQFSHTHASEGVGKVSMMKLTNPGTSSEEQISSPSEKVGSDSLKSHVNTSWIETDDRLR